MAQNTIVFGVIGADVHAVGNKILEYAYKQAGFDVVNLGVMVSQEEYIQAAIETDAHAIAVSSLYGHGEIDCRGFKEKCLEAGLKDVFLYVGGNLVVGKTPEEEVIKRFKNMGFDRVFINTVPLDECIAVMKKDMGVK